MGKDREDVQERIWKIHNGYDADRGGQLRFAVLLGRLHRQQLRGAGKQRGNATRG